VKTKKILIVDDEVHIRILLEQTLEDFENYGVEILIAENGKKALEMIKKEKPDLVFLDVMMPEINGYDVCNTVKNQLKLDDVYIAMLTAKGQEFDKKRGIEAGTDEYFTKPFDPDMIVRRSAAILGITELM
jgi:two-component system alkaline phosphatase synthesis response regulator PhoP